MMHQPATFIIIIMLMCILCNHLCTLYMLTEFVTQFVWKQFAYYMQHITCNSFYVFLGKPNCGKMSTYHCFELVRNIGVQGLYVCHDTWRDSARLELIGNKTQ